MVDTEPLTPALLPQEPTLQLLSPDHGRLQEQQHESDLALYHHSYQHHHHPDHSVVPFQPQDTLDDMTRDFLIQDANPDPSAQGSSPLLLQSHPDVPTEIEEELNIYDYIHAKQEDEEEPEDPSRHSSSSVLEGLEPTLDSSLRRASHHSVAADTTSLVDSAYFPSSPSSSSPSSSSPSSPSSPSDSSPMHHERIGTSVNTLGRHGGAAGDMDALSHESDYMPSSIKQGDLDESDASSLMHHSSYMDDSPVDLYGPMQSSQGEGDIHSPLPTPDLFRTLMDELQTQAAIQREKFFSATTGSDTGMDSVEFLFKGQHTQTPSQSQSQPSTPSTKQCPQFMTEVAADSMFVAGSSEVDATSEQSDDQDLSSMKFYSSDTAADPIKAEEADQSPSTSSTASELKRGKNSSSSRTGVVHVAFTRIAKRRSSTATCDAATTTALAQMDSPSMKVTVEYSSDQRSAGVTPNSKQSFQSALEHLSVETNGEISGAQDRSRTKRRKASHGQTVAQSPIQDTLPSPPASVQTTPPLQPMTQDLVLDGEELELPAASIVHPITPPSPAPVECTETGENAAGTDRGTDSGPGMDATASISIVTTPATDSKPLKKATTPSGAVNKRPWTPEEEKLLLELVDSKTPIKDIAETLSRSVHSVRSRRQVLTDPGFVKGNGHAQPRRAKPDPSSKLPTYSQMAFLSLARLPELQGTLNDVASMVEKLFSRYLNRIPRTGHKNLQIWRAQISDALAHEKGHPRPRFESFGIKRGRQWVYRLTAFGKGVMEAMGSVDRICDDLLKNNEMARGSHCGTDGDRVGGAGAGLGQGNGYGYSYSAETTTTSATSSGSRSPSCAENERIKIKTETTEESSAESLAVSNAIANAMAAMAAGMAAMTASEDEKSAAAGTTVLAPAALGGVESRKMSESVEKTKRAKAGVESHDTKRGAPVAATGGGRSGKRLRTRE
ncbi:hypothetical protein BGZ72_010101 [Mortierella alpina]|nr:hypothetical protein BGZ72_010101 [Mortierella alpina]